MILGDTSRYNIGQVNSLHLTSAEKINSELGWESIKDRIDFLGLSLFHKINYYETRPLVRSCLTERIFRLASRQYGHFMKYPNYGSKFNKLNEMEVALFKDIFPITDEV